MYPRALLYLALFAVSLTIGSCDGPGPTQPSTAPPRIGPPRLASIEAADVSIAITGPAEVPNATLADYTITVTNPTAETLIDFEVEIVRPQGIGFFSGLSVRPGGGDVQPACAEEFPSRRFICTLNSLAPGATSFIRAARASQEGTWTISATVSSDITDPNTANNTVAHTTIVTPGPDLTVSMAPSAPAVSMGENLTYTITVQNIGGGPTTGSTLTAFFPNGLVFVSLTTSAGTCTFTPQSSTRDTYRCDFGSVAPGASITVLLTATPFRPDLFEGRNTHSVEVSSTGGDLNIHNNSASATVILHPADVSVAVAGPASALTGEQFTHTVTLTNHGPSVLSEGVVEIEVTGATKLSATPSAGACGVMFCSASIAAGGTVTIAVVVASNVPTTARVIAEYRDSFRQDNTPADNQASAQTTIRRPEPVVTASGPSTVAEGGTHGYSFSVSAPSGSFTVSQSSCGEHGSIVSGSLVESPGSASFQCVFPDGPQTSIVSLTARDAGGGTGTASISVTIGNLAPTADFTAPATVVEGSAIALGIGNMRDPSTVDTDYGITVEFDCGSGSGFGASSECGIATDGPGTVFVQARVTDKDGGSRTYPATVTVLNADPSLSVGALPNVVFVSGDIVRVNGFFTDPGVEDDPWDYAVDWGAGLPATVGTVSVQGALPTLSRRYTVPGTYTVTVRVTDEDGGTDIETFTVTVSALSLTIDLQPGKSPNSVSARKPPSTIPVAVFGTGSFDATTVDPATLTLGNDQGNETPVARSSTGTLLVNPALDLNNDGRLDLVVHFSTAELQANGDITMTVGTTHNLVLRGRTRSPDGRHGIGTETLTIVP